MQQAESRIALMFSKSIAACCTQYNNKKTMLKIKNRINFF